MAVNSQEGEETYHEVPASKYWYLGDTIGAVPKAFLQYWTLLVVISTSLTLLIGVYTNWWQLLAYSLAKFIFIQAWIVTYPALLIGLPIVYWWYTRKQKQKRIQKQKDAENKRIRGILTAGGERKQ
jgi:H+/gluconate symporter-like permease